jgi:hypothetical protein
MPPKNKSPNREGFSLKSASSVEAKTRSQLKDAESVIAALCV